jgi:hypothetical protein
MAFSADEIDRYGRQLVLPEWGAAGQERLAAASLVVDGSGPAAEMALLYLAGAGVGAIRAAVQLDEARALNPHVAIAPAERSSAEEAVAVRIDGRSITGVGDRAAVGAAVAVEALKALLDLPFRARVDLAIVAGGGGAP